jgi:hypothetical protein
MMIKRFAIALFLWPVSLFSQQDAYDWQLWSEASVEYKQIPKLDLGLSFQNRLDRNVTRLRGNYLTLDASYKLGKGFRVLAAVRGASSARFDKLRFSAGLSRGFEFGKATSIKIRGLVQHQVFAGSDVRYGINVPQQNYRVRISLRQKLIKKTWLNVHSEPMWRKEGSEFGFYRLRSSVQIERSLPGPWTVNMGYMIQQGFKRGSNVQAVLIGVGYELKFKAKEKP